MAPLLKPDWSIRNFPMGKFCIGKFPIGESGATSKTGLALGFCGDSFSTSPWGRELGVGRLFKYFYTQMATKGFFQFFTQKMVTKNFFRIFPSPLCFSKIIGGAISSLYFFRKGVEMGIPNIPEKISAYCGPKIYQG